MYNIPVHLTDLQTTRVRRYLSLQTICQYKYLYTKEIE